MRFILGSLKRNEGQPHYSKVGTPYPKGVLIRGEPSPVPMCPSGRIRACPEQARVRLPSAKGGPESWRTVVRLANKACISKSLAVSMPRTLEIQKASLEARAEEFSVVTALSIEFVAKPQEAQRVQSTIPAAMARTLKDVQAYAGCLVMVSDQEERLINVITLWAGEDRLMRCAENVRWVHKLLAPFVDRCLRAQTYIAHVPALNFPLRETDLVGGCSVARSVPAEGEEVRVA
jgi:hypothetical protein